MIAAAVLIPVAVTAVPLELIDASSPPKTLSAMVLATLNGAGQAVPVSGSGALTQATVTCGNTSTTLLAAGAAASFVRVVNPPGGVSVGIRWDGSAATMTPPSDFIAGGGYIAWTSYVPSAQYTCIVAAGSQAITLVYK
jgi:hypothetical protein